MEVVEVASIVAGNAGLSCSVLVPSSCGVRSSSIKSDRKLLDGAGCWSSMCNIGVLSPDVLVQVMVMFELGVVGFKLMGGCGGSSLFVCIISGVDAGVNVGVGVCDAGVIVF